MNRIPEIQEVKEAIMGLNRNSAEGPDESDRGEPRSTVRGRTPHKVLPIEAPVFTLDELNRIIGNFGQKALVREGSYGCIFCAKLRNGQQVAIKKLDSSSSAEPDFDFAAQLSMVSRLKNEHFMTLMGYGPEGNNLILVYEFVTKGSLHDVFHDKPKVSDEAKDLIFHLLYDVESRLRTKGAEEIKIAAMVHFKDYTSPSSNNKYLLIEVDDGRYTLGNCHRVDGEFHHIQGYWEWAEDILARSQQSLKAAKTHFSLPNGLSVPFMVVYSGEGAARYFDEEHTRKSIYRGDNISWASTMPNKSNIHYFVDNGKETDSEISYFMRLHFNFFPFRERDEKFEEVFATCNSLEKERKKVKKLKARRDAAKQEAAEMESKVSTVEDEFSKCSDVSLATTNSSKVVEKKK
ncbi:putative protein kinase [Capsicum annuum]|uniref:Protein kinase domain-containing protein n=1 Tax=Capsicum annuum TaxID=4072 RepID=A0A2G2Z8M0_CAPAN|nr:putative protein kinase [Capsicum annuum]